MIIHLLHTNDIHSSLENHMRVGHAVRTLREGLLEAGAAVLTLDVGDVLDRVRPETEVTSGRINAALMGALGYDAWVFGNNEGLTIPRSMWPTLASLSKATWLTTNLRDSVDAPLPDGRDWMIRDFGDVRVGVVGVTERYELPYSVVGITVLDPIETAKRSVSELRRMGCDVVVVMSHLGLWRDRPLAQALDDADLILGGHSHHFMDKPEWVDGTPIFQAGKHGLAFGYSRIDFDEHQRVVRNVECERIDIDPHGPMDPIMQTAYRQEQPEMDGRLSQVVLDLSQPLATRLESESPFANALVDALFHAYPCDLGIMMSGALTASLRPGRVEIRHLLGACSTPTRPIRLTLRGRDILSFLQQSVQPESYQRPGLGYGFRGSIIGYMAVANATIFMKRAGNKPPRVERVLIGQESLDLDRWYRVVTCEFLWLSPAFDEFHSAKDVEFERPLVREVLLDYLARHWRPRSSNEIRFVETDDMADET